MPKWVAIKSSWRRSRCRSGAGYGPRHARLDHGLRSGPDRSAGKIRTAAGRIWSIQAVHICSARRVRKALFIGFSHLSGSDRGIVASPTQPDGVDRVTVNQLDLLPCCAFGPKSPSTTGTQAMAHNFAINDDVHHQLQGPQGRAVVKQRSVYTIVSRLPIESDGRPRYRIKSKTENIERVVTEEQISRLG